MKYITVAPSVLEAAKAGQRLLLLPQSAAAELKLKPIALLTANCRVCDAVPMAVIAMRYVSLNAEDFSLEELLELANLLPETTEALTRTNLVEHLKANLTDAAWATVIAEQELAVLLTMQRLPTELV